MSKKFGLVLGAGGARGAAHIGLLQALEEEGIKPDIITGCSMGSIVGGAYAAGLTPAELIETVRAIKATDIIDPGALAVTRLGVFKGNKIHKILLAKLGNVTFEELKIPFECVAVDILGGRLAVLNSGSVAEAVRASSAIPTIFRPVSMNGMLLVDGGVLCRVPVRQCKALGADVVVAFDVLSNTGESVESIPSIVHKVLRVFDIMDYHQNETSKRDNRDCYDLWLEPEMPGLSAYNVKDAEKAYELGYEYAKQNMWRIKKALGD